MLNYYILLVKLCIINYILLIVISVCLVIFYPSDTPSSSTVTIDQKELTRPRLDTGLSIYSQITSVFEELPSPTSSVKPSSKLDSPVEKFNSDGDMTIIHIADPADELVSSFASRNILTLQQLNGGNVLLDVCVELPSLKSYSEAIRSILLHGDELRLATSVTDAMCLRSR